MVQLNIYLNKIIDNYKYILNLCNNRQLKLTTVTKCVQSQSEFVREFYRNGAEGIADVHIENLIQCGCRNLEKSLLLVAKSSITPHLKNIDYLYVSEFEILELISQLYNQMNKIIIPVDLGDLREGLPPEHLLTFVKEAVKLDNISIEGISVNFGCLRGLLPTEKNLSLLVDLYYKIKKQIGLELKYVSVGGTIIYDFIKDMRLPTEINHVRIGEAIFFGYNMSYKKIIPELNQDTFILKSEIIEIKEKNTEYGNVFGYNAFGKISSKESKGIRKRAVLNFGELTSPIFGLVPLLKGIEVIGSTHDHTVIDITNCEKDLKIGDYIEFHGGYNSISHLMVTAFPYVKKVLIGNTDEKESVIY